MGISLKETLIHHRGLVTISYTCHQSAKVEVAGFPPGSAGNLPCTGRFHGLPETRTYESVNHSPHSLKTHMTEPGQCPAGSRVTVKCRGWRSEEEEEEEEGAFIVMATGYSMGKVLR